MNIKDLLFEYTEYDIQLCTFKAYHKRLKIMLNCDCIDFSGNTIRLYDPAMIDDREEGCFLLSDCILLRCTGKKDKNKQYIYEGDIFKTYSNSILCIVKWDKEKCRFVCENENSHMYIPMENIHIYEKIGSIYKDKIRIKEINNKK